MLTLIRHSLSVVLLGLVTLAAFAQTPSRDMEKEKAICQQLEAIAPKSVETFKAATAALDKGDYKEAERLYTEVLKQAPSFDPVYRRLGTSLMLAGRTNEGLALLETAVQMKPSPENLNSLATSLAYPGEGKESSAENKTRALTLAKQAYQAYQGTDDPSYALLVTQLYLELEREAQFREMMKVLQRQYPNIMATHYFNAIRASMDEDWITAEDEIKQAQRLGLSAEAANKLLDSGIHTRAMAWRYTYYALYLVVGWIVGLGLLFLLGKILSNVTLRSIETADPNGAASSQEVSLRKFYRHLINIAGLYYYISIPVVMLLVIGVVAGVIYGCLMLGRIPIKLVGILVIGSLITLYKMIRSLFIRINAEDPGRDLRPEEAPGLWALTREVAQAMGTRPIDEIRVTPGTELAVYERGNFRERAQDQARRILILGVGTLNGFNQNAFRAVLAHEYGHFSHRDTAGGDVALRVNADMMKFAVAMAHSGQAVWWNIAFQFLRVYHFIFRRISHGATRLQEVLADRVAVRTYGARAFEEGLTHVVRRGVEFGYLASKEIQEAAQFRRDLSNLYQLPEVGEAQEKLKIADEINQALNRPTTEDDTHPSPTERFRLASRIASPAYLPATGAVWELFANRESLTSEMSSLINAQMKEAAVSYLDLS